MPGPEPDDRAAMVRPAAESLPDPRCPGKGKPRHRVIIAHSMLEPLFALIFAHAAQIRDPAVPLDAAGVITAFFGLFLYWFFGWHFTREQVSRHRAQAPGAPYREPIGLRVLNFLFFLGLLWFTPWPALCEVATGGLPFLGTLAVFLPYPVNRLLRAISLYEAERNLPDRVWTRGQFLAYQMRVILVMTAPILILTGARDLLISSKRFEVWRLAYEDLTSVATNLGLLFLVFALSPLIVRHVLGARPLEPGGLRDRLTAYGARTGFKPNEILVWPTGNTVTNAMFVGILPFFRYIVLTDGLIRTHDEDSIEAVYAHEAGHGKRHHTLLYLIMVCGFWLLLSAIETRISSFAMSYPQYADMVAGLALAVTVGSMVAFVFIGLGWLSRRFEAEADLYAVKTLGNPYDLVRSLTRIGERMGIPAHHEGFRHFGIATRASIIESYLQFPEFRASFDRLMRRCRSAILLLFLAGFAWVAYGAPEVIGEGRIRRPLLLAEEYLREGRLEEARSEAEAAARYGADAREKGGLRRAAVLEVHALALLGDILLYQGNVEGALELAGRMAERVSDGDAVGAFNARNLAVLAGVILGKADAAEVRQVLDELQQLSIESNRSPDADSGVYGDLFLALRAAGDGKTPAPGSPGAYRGMARLLDAYERSGSHALTGRLMAAAREDLSRAAFRRMLLSRMPDLPPGIREMAEEGAPPGR